MKIGNSIYNSIERIATQIVNEQVTQNTGSFTVDYSFVGGSNAPIAFSHEIVFTQSFISRLNSVIYQKYIPINIENIPVIFTISLTESSLNGATFLITSGEHTFVDPHSGSFDVDYTALGV